MTNQEKNPVSLTIYREFIVRGNRFAIIQRTENDQWGSGLWEIPGGKLKGNQDVSHAGDDEIFEESQMLTLPLTSHKIVFQRMLLTGKYAGLPYIEIVGISKHEAGEIKLSDEHQNSEWVTPDEATTYKLTDTTRKALILQRPLLELAFLKGYIDLSEALRITVSAI